MMLLLRNCQAAWVSFALERVSELGTYTHILPRAFVKAFTAALHSWKHIGEAPFLSSPHIQFGQGTNDAHC